MQTLFKNRQAQAPSFEEILRLPVLADVYTDAGRVKNNPQNMIAIIDSIDYSIIGSYAIGAHAYFVDDINQVYLGDASTSITLVGCHNDADLRNALANALVTAAAGNSITVSAADFSWPTLAKLTSPAESALSLSLQTSTGAVGTQVSATQDAWVLASGVPSTTASIAGNASADIVFEVAPTNSATPGDWVEKGRLGNSQALSLAITLQSIQVVKGQVVLFVPKGYYIKARQIGSGTTAFSLGAVRKVLI